MSAFLNPDRLFADGGTSKKPQRYLDLPSKKPACLGAFSHTLVALTTVRRSGVSLAVHLIACRVRWCA